MVKGPNAAAEAHSVGADVYFILKWRVVGIPWVTHVKVSHDVGNVSNVQINELEMHGMDFWTSVRSWFWKKKKNKKKKKHGVSFVKTHIRLCLNTDPATEI